VINLFSSEYTPSRTMFLSCKFIEKSDSYNSIFDNFRYIVNLIYWKINFNRIIFLVASLTFYLFNSSAKAEIEICNETKKIIYIAIATNKIEKTWRSSGFYSIDADICKRIGGTFNKRFYYYYWMTTNDSGSLVYGVNEKDSAKKFCILDESSGFPPFDIPYTRDCSVLENGSSRNFYFFDSGEKFNCRILMQNESNAILVSQACPINIKSQQIYERCLVSWDDSHQIHSSELIIKWEYQAWKTVAKRLNHCIKLRASGPISVQGIAQGHIDQCIDKALNGQKTRFILQALISIVVDINGGGGSATSSTALAYIDHVANESISCLTDLDGFSKELGEILKEQFKATIENESEWVYWNL
jgi:uncharacterized membrane protein